ncbi:phosphotransferase family protein [Mumia sp. Pv 4-285]|uniref:phosphotransferase family protein n=1 Tax=Mumia qirimensis TaxID=3234852 RepID=UPI00351CE8D6
MIVRVRVEGDVVVKHGPGAELVREARKLRAYEEFAGGLFVVPRPLAVDEEAGVMRMSRLEGFVPVVAAFDASKDAPRAVASLFSRTGGVLARIHGHSEVTRRWLADALTTPVTAGHVVLHGDFGFSNVLVRLSDSTIGVIDPTPAPYVEPRDVGPPIRDLAHMTSCLLGRRGSIIRYATALRLPRRRLLEAFLDGYAAESGSVPSWDAVVEAGQEHLRTYLVRGADLPRPIASATAFVWAKTL